MSAVLIVFLALAGSGLWTSIGPEGGDINSPVQSQTNPAELWAYSGSNPIQIVTSTDAGLTWESIASVTGGTAYDMVVCSNGDLVLGGSSRTWTSTDGGQTWTGNYLSNVIFYDLVAHPTDPAQVFGCGYAYDGNWKYSFMHSTDGGNSFAVTHVALPGTYTYSYGRSIALGKSDPSVILLGGYGYSTTDATYVPLVMKSDNGGSTFTDITPAEASGQYYFYGVGVNPLNPDILLAGSLQSMYRSTDGGVSWTKVAASQTYNYRIAFSDADPNLVFAGGSSRVYRSTDGGVSWSGITSGLDGSDIQWAVPSWSDDTVAFTGSSVGFYRSANGGSSWSGSNEGLIVGKVLAMEESQGWIFMNMEDMGVFKTPASATVQWEEVNTPLACGDFCDICADGAGTLLALEGSG